jgi:hypothetical protein
VWVDDKHIDDYLQVLTDLAAASGGGLTGPPQTVGDCPDWEDNRSLDLAAEVGAWVIVSADNDLLQMSGHAEFRRTAWSPDTTTPAVVRTDRRCEHVRTSRLRGVEVSSMSASLVEAEAEIGVSDGNQVADVGEL